VIAEHQARLGFGAAQVSRPTTVSASAQAAAQLQQQKAALAAQINQAAANLQSAWTQFQAVQKENGSWSSGLGFIPVVAALIGYAKTMQASANTADNVATAMTQLVKTQATINDAQAASAAHQACAQLVNSLPAATVAGTGWFVRAPSGGFMNASPGSFTGPGFDAVTRAYQYANNAIAAAMNALTLSPAPAAPSPARASTNTTSRVGMGAKAGGTAAGTAQGASSSGASSTPAAPVSNVPLTATDNSNHSVITLAGRTVTITFPAGTKSATADGVVVAQLTTAGLSGIAVTLPTMVLTLNGYPGDVNVAWTLDGTTYSSMNVQLTTTTLAAVGSNTKPVAAKKKVGTSTTTKVAYAVAGVAVVGAGTAAYLRYR
jgi:hypothetical protein